MYRHLMLCSPHPIPDKRIAGFVSGNFACNRILKLAQWIPYSRIFYILHSSRNFHVRFLGE